MDTTATDNRYSAVLLQQENGRYNVVLKDRVTNRIDKEYSMTLAEANELIECYVQCGNY